VPEWTPSEWANGSVDSARAEGRREPAIEYWLYGRPIVSLEPIYTLAQQAQRVGGECSGCLEQIEIAECVVPANRHHHVRCVAGDCRHLSGHRTRRCTINGEQRRARGWRKQRAQVLHHVRLRSRVGAVVEDRVPEQHDVHENDAEELYA